MYLVSPPESLDEQSSLILTQLQKQRDGRPRTEDRGEREKRQRDKTVNVFFCIIISLEINVSSIHLTGTGCDYETHECQSLLCGDR